MYFIRKDSRVKKNRKRINGSNYECILMFFDNHDMWHFTSALGLFFTFMWLLTLEDNNTDTPWEEIPVF